MGKKATILVTACVMIMVVLFFEFFVFTTPTYSYAPIYINADGSITPPTAPIYSADNIRYTLTGNITADADGIVIERDNIVLDGAGYTVTASYASMLIPKATGITLTSVSNVTVRNMTITKFLYGISLSNSCNNVLSGNNVTANSNYGIKLESSSNDNVLSGNDVANNNWVGIELDSSSNNTVGGNNAANNWGGISLYSSSRNTLSGNNVTANSENGIYLESSSNNVLSGNNVTANSGYGVELDFSSGNSLVGNDAADNGYGVWLGSSSNNTLSGNVMASNEHNFFVMGSVSSDFLQSVDTSNLADGKPVYYFVNQSNIVVNAGTYPEVGYMGFVNCANVTVQGLNLTDNSQGLLLANTNASEITGNNAANNLYGIDLESSSNNVLSGNNIANNLFGIWLSSSSGNTLSANNLTPNNGYGIYLESSPNNVLSGNNVTANHDVGIDLFSSPNNVLSGNNVTNNGYGVELDYSSNNESISGNTFLKNGLLVWDSYGNVVVDNLVNDRPLVYLESVSDYTVVSDAAQVVLVNCNSILLENLNLSYTDAGVELWGTNNTTISGSNITANTAWGILLEYSSNNSVNGNNITADNFHGVDLEYSSNNSVNGNNITNTYHGVDLYSSSNNRVYHNNFINNTQQVDSSNSTNVWDDGYPSGGNYWSDYNGTDMYGGQYQNVTGSDGIGDTPYAIDANNTDHYPMMNLYSSTSFYVAKTVIGKGLSTYMCFAVANYGNDSETLNVTAYANTTSITSENVTLTSGKSATIRFSWNTTGFAYGTYSLAAYAWSASNETNTANDNFTGGLVTVSIPGDINGDFKVSSTDLALLQKAYGSKPGDTKWNPNADINGDSKVSLSDLVILAQHYGQHYP